MCEGECGFRSTKAMKRNVKVKNVIHDTFVYNSSCHFMAGANTYVK